MMELCSSYFLMGDSISKLLSETLALNPRIVLILETSLEGKGAYICVDLIYFDCLCADLFISSL